MEIDYLDDIGTDYLSEKMLRITNFTTEDLLKLKSIIDLLLSLSTNSIDLTRYDFIKFKNCKLKFELNNENLGIVHNEDNDFTCVLNIEGYNDINEMLKVQIESDSGHYFLANSTSGIEFLLSKHGGW